MVTKSNKSKRELNYLTQEEIKEKIKNLHLSQRGEEGLDTSFSGYYFGDWITNEGKKNEKTFEIDVNIFKLLDLTGADFSNSKIPNYISLEGTNLTGADFRGAEFSAKIDSYTNLTGADFRGAEYDIQEFNEKQKKQIIFTDMDYENYQKKLQEENKELKEITKNTSEEQINKLIDSFLDMKNQFSKEETLWLMVSFIAFICLLFFLAIPILDMFMYQNTYKIVFWSIIVIVGLIFTITTVIASNSVPQNKVEDSFWKEIWQIFKKGWAIIIYVVLVITSLDNYLSKLGEPKQPVFHINNNYALFPFGFLLVTFLYFSVFQYSKSKRLRIENQNKVALLHGLTALRTDTGNDINKEIFYNNTANVVFDKIYQEKEANLPIDKILDIINLVKK